MNILAVTTMRNEGPHCIEWIAHHLAAGIDHFLIFSDRCTDGTDAILEVMAGQGLVTHVRLETKGRKSHQWQALQQATRQPCYQSADWVLATDCDEFINLRGQVDNLKGLVTAISGADAVAIPWRLFGNSGEIQSQNSLTIERFTHAAPENLNLPLSHFFKSFFQRSSFGQLGVHRPKGAINGQSVWVDGGGNVLPDNFAEQEKRINLFGIPVSSEMVQLNHYSLRSAENFMVKRARGLPNHMERQIDLGYWVERNFNSDEELSILKMLPATRARFDELMEFPGMRDLHIKSLQKHREIFENLMLDRAEVQLFWHLAMAADSQPPTVQLARDQLKRIAAAR